MKTSQEWGQERNTFSKFLVRFRVTRDKKWVGHADLIENIYCMGTWCCQDYLVGIIISFILPYQGKISSLVVYQKNRFHHKYHNTSNSWGCSFGVNILWAQDSLLSSHCLARYMEDPITLATATALTQQTLRWDATAPIRGKIGVHNILVKPELWWKPTSVNTIISWIQI